MIHFVSAKVPTPRMFVVAVSNLITNVQPNGTASGADLCSQGHGVIWDTIYGCCPANGNIISLHFLTYTIVQMAGAMLYFWLTEKMETDLKISDPIPPLLPQAFGQFGGTLLVIWATQDWFPEWKNNVWQQFWLEYYKADIMVYVLSGFFFLMTNWALGVAISKLGQGLPSVLLSISFPLVVVFSLGLNTLEPNGRLAPWPTMTEWLGITCVFVGITIPAVSKFNAPSEDTGGQDGVFMAWVAVFVSIIAVAGQPLAMKRFSCNTERFYKGQCYLPEGGMDKRYIPSPKVYATASGFFFFLFSSIVAVVNHVNGSEFVAEMATAWNDQKILLLTYSLLMTQVQPWQQIAVGELAKCYQATVVMIALQLGNAGPMLTDMASGKPFSREGWAAWTAALVGTIIYTA